MKACLGPFLTLFLHPIFLYVYFFFFFDLISSAKKEKIVERLIYSCKLDGIFFIKDLRILEGKKYSFRDKI